MSDLDPIDALFAALEVGEAPLHPPALPREHGALVLLARHRAPPQDVARTEAALAERVGQEAVTVLLARMIPVAVRAGSELLVHGEPADALYLLCEGSLEAALDLDGRHLELGQVQPGAWLGEVNLLDGGPASATLRVTRDARLMRLTRDDLAELRASHPAVALALTRSLNRDLAQRVRRCSAGLVQRLADGGFRLDSADDARRRQEQLLAGLVIADLVAA